MTKRMPRTLGPWSYVSLILACAALAFFFPFGNWRDAKIMTMASTTSSPIYMTGTSVLKHISACDSDQRHVTQMMAARLGSQVTDLSYGGQTLIEQAAYLGTAMHNPQARVLIASASLGDFTPTSEPAFRRRLLFTLASPPSQVRYASDDVADLVMGRDLPESFDYDGEHFASYDYIKQKYLSVEREHSTCPETQGYDHRFVKAIYYGNYVVRPIDDAAVALMARTAAQARAHGKQFFLVVMPVDMELVKQLDPAWVNAIQALRDRLVARLGTQGVSVLDLSEQVPDAGFADRWCACGHLQSLGRERTADRLADELRQRVDWLQQHH